MIDENLVMLSLDLDIPNLWENNLVREFPGSTFTIKNAHPLGNDSFSGLLQAENVGYPEMNKYIEENHPSVSLERFHSGSSLYHYITPDKLLPKVLRNTRAILSWPVPLLESGKRVKFILKNYEVENVMTPLEDADIGIKRFSKVRMDFNLKEILTPKQKKILGPSLNHGYYQFPKKISLNELSRKIGVSPSTLCVHLQKIESKLIGANGSDLFL